MPHVDRRLLIVLCALVFAGALLLDRSRSSSAEPSGVADSPPSQSSTPEAAPPPKGDAGGSTGGADAAAAGADGPILVHVVGAVRRPGVYRLPASARGLDALRVAGGAARRADLAGLNLAAPLSDGQQVVVPLQGQTPAPTSGAAAARPGKGSSPQGPVHLSTADAAALDALPGVGPATAARIIAWREGHGAFRSVDDLLEVPGIGPAKLEALRDQVVP